MAHDTIQRQWPPDSTSDLFQYCSQLPQADSRTNHTTSQGKMEKTATYGSLKSGAYSPAYYFGMCAS